MVAVEKVGIDFGIVVQYPWKDFMNQQLIRFLKCRS
jgi:hypothetical protein